MNKNKNQNTMSIYCFGSTIHGECALGGIEEEQVKTRFKNKHETQ